MAASILADTGFLVALLRRRDAHNAWAAAAARAHPPPWNTCEAVLSEAFFILQGSEDVLSALVRRGMLASAFSFADHAEPVLALLKKYQEVPMSFADACLVRMSELAAEPLVLTTDSDFTIYHRNGRKVIPCAMPA